MSDLENDLQPYLPVDSRGIPIQKNHGSRRSSILDVGGVSSINNFASSLQRSVNYLAKSFDSSNDTDLDQRNPILTNSSINNDLNTVLINDELSNHINHDTDLIHSIPSNNNYGSVNEEIIDFESNDGNIIKIIKSNDSETIKIISLKSTPLQTIFNSINVLIGLGILSIPLALHLSGWILGIICITFAALITKQTSILLGRILKKHPQLKTYQDIGIFCFGEKIGVLILITFALDLLGAGISMILLFADSFNALSPDIFSKISLKLIITSLLMLLNFLPLRLLSFLSLSGIICTTLTCLIIGISGLIKIDSPGSLLNPMKTNLYPISTIDFLFALGLYLAPWGGHATFPEIYKDQLYPETYDNSMNYSFSFSYMIDLITGILGFLMFGELVDDEITKNILTTNGFPKWISTVIIILMGILPISKLPLISRPLLTILDNKVMQLFNKNPKNTSKRITTLQKIFNRFILSLLFFLCSILLTNFGKVMSLLGSLICFTVCITLPGLYYLKIFNNELTAREKLLWRMIVVAGVAGAVLGTIAVILK